MTGDFVIPAPREGLPVIGQRLPGRSVGGNPFVRQRNVVPAEFKQDQFTVKLDGQLTANQRLSGDGLLRRFSRLRSVPGSLVARVALHARARRSERDVRRDPHTRVIGGNKVNEIRGGVFYLRNSRQLDDPFRDLTNACVGVPNPATFFDSSDATLRLGHYVGPPGTTMERFSFGGPNDIVQQAASADT